MPASVPAHFKQHSQDSAVYLALLCMERTMNKRQHGMIAVLLYSAQIPS
jgi:hypothetical protein